MPVGDDVLLRHNLTREEYDRIVRLLGREPNPTEIGLFSVMWSEHCSYKSSKVHLRTLPTEGPRVVQGPGENAGAVAIGDGLAAVFKIESHNHPSFIEPYQGAATGVGGILRDVFTMGARPNAVLNSLRFGPPTEARNRRLLAGVVAGIGGYGNAFGCPTVGGEVVFEDSYEANPLVNALCLGLVRTDRIFRARASGVGNTVFYVGAKTGRDGIHSATMASAEFGEGSEERRPTVQVGDPFMEKVLLEACLEAMRTGAIVGIQDMGAAGLTCSSSEMGARAGTGIRIDIAKVPKRETGMTAYEVMLSESQERMLLVAEKGREADVVRVFEKWDLHAEPIGAVTDDGRLRVFDGEGLEADVPNSALTDEAPVYERPWVEPRNPAAVVDVLAFDPPPDLPGVLLALLASPTIACKRWVYRQYDSTVRSNTLVGPGSDAAVVRVKGTRKALALKTDGNGRYCWLDPYEGARLAVAEACRNVVAAGATPIGATNCLNFGNPERPEIMGQFALTVRGMGDACRALSVPITGGNVSFYNETDGRAIYPTPVIGVVGLIEDAARALTNAFKEEGEAVYLLGDTAEDLGGGELVQVVHGKVAGRPPRLDLGAEGRLHALVLEAAGAGWLRSAHDCSDGGVAVALAECALGAEGPGPGGRFDLPGTLRPDILLFSETPSRMLVTTREEARLRAAAHRHRVPCHRLGIVGGDRLTVTSGHRELVDLDMARLHAAWMSLERLLSAPAE
ncbi:MAG: phosphoribosylformylglycinamidine synthase II [Acidobacteria bacterium RBG_16_70_10]|nr:MAG: phosphoribosylformylglycinamidine synthase II [Acidobacteria bacterium RBG_16_70_10]